MTEPTPPATILPSTVIVLHPGAYNLRLGFASESSPFIIPHVIARRVYDAKKVPVMTPPPPLAPGPMGVKLQGLHAIKLALQALTDGAEPPDEYAEPIYTESTCATPLLGTAAWTDTSNNPSYVVGEAALKLGPALGSGSTSSTSSTSTPTYTLHRPMRSSSLSPSAGYPKEAITNDLQAIWTEAITSKLGVESKLFGSYHICLVVPDAFGKSEIKDFLHILLRDMGFGAVMVVPSAMCATIGSGLSTACVVDVGHSRTSVCCVDEGSTVLGSRRVAAYGFSDVARLAAWLVRQPDYPYYFPTLPYQREEFVFHDLIESHATLIPESVHATKTFEFKHYNPPAPPVLYHTSISDVTSIAPMGLFYPEAFKPLACEIYEKDSNNTRENNYNNHYHNYNDPEDLYDDPYLLEGNATPRTTRPEIDHDGLDLVVAASIGGVGDKNDLKRKLYGSILLTGGASRLPGLESLLEDRLFDRLPSSLSVERVEVVPSGSSGQDSLGLGQGQGLGAAYRDPGLRGDCLAWRGAAIIANVETSRDMWIPQKDWAREGPALLRDRLLFGPL